MVRLYDILDVKNESKFLKIKICKRTLLKVYILSLLGVSALEVPPIEPMKIKTIVVKTAGSTSSFNLISSFKDARIHGLSTSSVVRTAVKFKKFQMKTDAFTKRMDFEGSTANII